MPMFAVNSRRLDPYPNCNFQVIVDGAIVAAVQKCSAITKTTETLKWRDSTRVNNPVVVPAASSYEPITLEQGTCYDMTLVDWAALVHDPLSLAGMSLASFRKDIGIVHLNRQGVPVFGYTLMRAFPSSITLSSDFDTNSVAISLRTLKIEYEGWVIDDQVVETAET